MPWEMPFYDAYFCFMIALIVLTVAAIDTVTEFIRFAVAA